MGAVWFKHSRHKGEKGENANLTGRAEGTLITRNDMDLMHWVLTLDMCIPLLTVWALCGSRAAGTRAKRAKV